jgi:large subunit ribosomal protein L15
MQGGRGKSGWCKHKWTHVVKFESSRIGKLGYRCPTGRGRLTVVNVGDLEGLSERCGASDKSTVTLDLSKLGYQKLLGEGKVGKALQVIVGEWSKTAEKKVQESGGKILAPQKNGV